MLLFGLTYEVDDAKYWRITKKLSEESLNQVLSDNYAQINTITFMKQAGVLSNKACRQVSSLVDNLSDLAPDQLIHFLLMYSTSDMQKAVDISSNIDKVENALRAK